MNRKHGNHKHSAGQARRLTNASKRGRTVLAFHAIISAYGFWLPNDPRGSWSTFVGQWELFRFGGGATKVTTTRSVADRPHDKRSRLEAKSTLKHPLVRFDGYQALSVANGMRDVAEQSGYGILALAIMPAHLHTVVAASERAPAQVIGHLKRGATDRLIADRRHPCSDGGRITHSCWSKQAWKVFLDTAAQVERAIRYVEDNPAKEDKRHQQWAFIDPQRRQFFATNSARQAGRLTDPRDQHPG